MNKQITFFGITYIIVGVILLIFMLLYYGDVPFNFKSVFHFILMFTAGIGILMHKRIGWISGTVFSIEMLIFTCYSIIKTIGNPFFGESSETMIIAIVASIIVLIIISAIIFFNQIKVLNLFKINRLIRVLTIFIGVLIALYGILDMPN